MSDTVRALSLLLSVLLWAPVGAGLLRGEIPAEKAILLYAGALVLSLVGCSMLAGLLRAYTPEPEPEPEPAELPEPAADADPATPVVAGAPGRRVEDGTG